MGQIDCDDANKSLKDPINVAVTGAAGQVAYSLLYMIGRGEAFGKDQSINLNLFDVNSMMRSLEGVAMELEDCALPLVNNILLAPDVETCFKDAAAIFLIGSSVRIEGMNRKSLFQASVPIFKEQAEAINQVALKDVKVLVLANPCNTNAYVCSHYATCIPKENFSALSRLDHNRTKVQIARRLGIPAQDVQNVVIWGGRSGTQFPDIRHATVSYNGVLQSAVSALADEKFLQNTIVTSIQKRNPAILAARKLASAMSQAKAACDQMHDWWNGTRRGEFVSMSVLSDGSYGIPKDIFYSFPVQIRNKKWRIVKGLPIDEFAREKLDASARELVEEKEEALALCEEVDVDQGGTLTS
ncbi:malate dehydrogenase, cytoplasmic-like isoform X3 [Hermetia illucens]|uniref:malate dehydrogenase, cytoplasmic-like isoform X3 n=1 Tax=Hermetia illucens TaxID=343691 RepID=UPI0018CC52E6|nr:malate dehydrogenase, cytoplasmic-like isoform X3 [Hermetia illucens]